MWATCPSFLPFSIGICRDEFNPELMMVEKIIHPHLFFCLQFTFSVLVPKTVLVVNVFAVTHLLFPLSDPMNARKMSTVVLNAFFYLGTPQSLFCLALCDRGGVFCISTGCDWGDQNYERQHEPCHG